MDDVHARRLRLRAQRLEPRWDGGGASLARAVCGLQAQDPRAALLSVRVRTAGLTAAGVEAEPGLVRTWAWRGTLHLLAAEDLAWVHALVAPAALRGAGARWRGLGLDAAIYERARAAIGAALAEEGPLSRAQLRRRLAAAGVDASGQRLPHLVRRAALEGLLAARLDDTYAALAPPSPPPRELALAQLARRYLAAYGPAEPRDLAAWSGLPAADVRGAWRQVEAELIEVTIGGRRAWRLGPGPPAEPAAAPPVVRLLPGFDTSLLGHHIRALAVAAEHARRVRPGGGWLHPVLLVDGRAAGTWSLRRRRDGVAIAVTPFAALPDAAGPGLEAEAQDVGRFLGCGARLAVG